MEPSESLDVVDNEQQRNSSAQSYNEDKMVLTKSQIMEQHDQRQADIRATHLMMSTLSALVHRTSIKSKTRGQALSESPSSTNNKTLSFFRSPAPNGIATISHLPADHPLDLTSDPSFRSDTKMATCSSNSASPEVRPVPKKKSLELAVLNSEFAKRQSLTRSPENFRSKSDNFEDVIEAVATGGSQTHLEAKQLQHTPDDEVSRHFSLSPSLRKPTSSGKRRKSLLLRRQRTATVLPEDILSARNLDRELSRFTLYHESSYRYAWDLLIMAMILLDVIFTPLSLGFHYTPPFMNGLNICGTVLFVIDFFVHLFSSYTNERGDLVSGLRRTAMHYLLSGWAIPDFLSWFPFELLASSSRGRVLSFTKIFRLAKVSQLARKFNSAKKAGILRFILLLGIVLTIVHLLACYWSWVAQGWRSHLSENTFVPQSLFEEYTLCWSLVVGCINASPPPMYTAIEQISVACFMLVGNILQASVFGSVAVLISSFDEDEAAYNKKIITASERCRHLGISEALTKRIRGYYENLWRETKSVSSDADSFINELSPSLICEIKFQLYRDMLKQIPFLSSKTLAPAVIEMLILHLRTVIYMQDDVLIRKGEFGDWMGFIGSKGSVGVLDPNTETRRIIRILRRGDYFGEMALLQRAKRSTTAIALTWVQIHVLCRNDLDSVKEQYPTQTEILEHEINKYMQTKVRYK